MPPTPAVTLTFTLTDITSNPIAGQVVLTLVNYGSVIPTVIGTETIAQLTYVAPAASNGTGSVTFWGNYQLNATSTYYQIQIYGVDELGNVDGAANLVGGFQFNSSGTFDLSNLNALAVYPGPQPPLGIPGPAGQNGTNGSNGAPGPTGSISATSGPSPWIDVQAYGAKPRPTTPPATTATTFSGSPNVTLALARDFVNGDGLVIYTAGAATAQSTPSAPTVTAPVVQGSATYNYQIVGVDALGGLTAASSVASVTNGPAVFGNLPVVISSINQSSGTVTVNFATPITATSGMQIAIRGFTTGSAIFNGFWPVATAPTTSQITFALSGNFGAGTVSGSTTGRLCNTYNLTAASRSGTTLSFTTNANHNFQVGAIVIIDGVPSPSGFNSGAVQLGNGILSAAANNVLNLNIGTQLAAGVIRCNVWGTEE